jgi:molybdopterin-guanine dinucleotide biosynthesis protein MobB
MNRGNEPARIPYMSLFSRVDNETDSSHTQLGSEALKVILFIGYSGSGKTSAIRTVAGALKRRGRKVATIKHIHDTNFTIDTPGKDTWFHAAAGASIVVSLAPKELTIIRKEDTTKMKLDRIINMLKKEKTNYVLIEGLYRRLSTKRGVIRVLCVTSKRDAESFLKNRPRPDYITGRLARGQSGRLFRDVPLVEFPKDTAKFLKLIR